MRALALWILIALVPLRLWAADAMALSMLAPHASSAAGAFGAQGDDLAAPACPAHAAAGQPGMYAAPAAPHGVADAPTVDGGDTSRVAVHADAAPAHAHTLCDVCNGPALAASWHLLPLGAPAHVALDRPAERFASASLARGLKPPIA